ncbi:hypothetical protein D6D26_01235, partial [Aureobasidium pullulans]
YLSFWCLTLTYDFDTSTTSLFNAHRETYSNAIAVGMGSITALSTADLPSDVYYLAQLTPTNHGGVVWVICVLSLTYALLCSGIRYTLRRGMYGFDDAALLVSTIACIVQHAFVFLALENGLGVSVSGIAQKHHDVVAKSTYTRLVLFFVVHYLAKMSLTLFTRRLFDGQEKYYSRICDALLVLNFIFGVVSILLMSISCESGWYFATRDVCPGLFTRWVAIKTLDVVGELALVLVPILLICKILLNSKHKAVIVATFAARLPVIAFTIVHFYYLRKSFHSTKDRGISLVQPVVWLQVTLLWSMVTASLPSFRPLISPFDTVMEDSSDRSASVFTGAALVLGTEKEEFGDPAATSRSRLSQLEPVASVPSRHRDFKGHNETIIEGPKKKLFRLSKKEDDIELGTIQHTKDFEIRYEEAAKPSRWSKVWRESGSSFMEKENDPAPVEAVETADETPAPRRRSTYAFIDEADLITEVQEASDEIVPT